MWGFSKSTVKILYLAIFSRGIKGEHTTMADTNKLTFLGIKGDPGTAYAKNGMVLSFASLTTGVRADFKAFIESLMDNFNSGWASEQPYGKSDPIRHFSSTQRTMQITWSCHAADEEEAADNMRRISALAQMQYPVYENRGYAGPKSTNTLMPTGTSKPQAHRRWCIAAPPLIAVKFANLIQSMVPTTDITDLPKGAYPDNGTVSKRLYGEQKIEGLICAFDSLQINPRIEVGFFEAPSGVLYPKAYDLSCMMTVLHQVSPNLQVDSLTGEFEKAFGDIYGVGFSNPDGFGPDKLGEVLKKE
jgi:hypothetical protein